MRTLLFAALILAFASYSCKKKQLEFVLTGNVMALNSGDNLSNVLIKVYTSSLGTAEKLAESVITDGAGNYKVVIERSKYAKIRLELSKENYFQEEHIYSIDDLSSEYDNHTFHTLSPKSWTKFVIKNATLLEETDELKIFKVSGKTDCPECCENGNRFFHGIIDTSFVCANDGGTYMKFYFWVNGNEYYGEDSVFNTPFDTLEYSIIY